MDHDGQTILVQLLFKELVGVDPADGTVLWTVPFPGNVAVIPTPIVSGDMVYATAGYGAGCVMVKLNGDEADVVYENKNMTNHHGGVILLDGHVYGHSDGKGWVCQNLESGEIAWREREAFGKGAIGYADGRFYCLARTTGEVVDDHGQHRRLGGTWPIYARTADKDSQGQGQDLDAPGDRRWQALSA